MGLVDDLAPEVARLRTLAEQHEAEADAAEALGSAAELRAQAEALMVQARDAWGRPDQDGSAYQRQSWALEEKAARIEAAPTLRAAAVTCRAEADAIAAGAAAADAAS